MGARLPGRQECHTVAVVTDSTVSLPEALLESLNIHTVAYYLHRGHEVLRDLITIQRDEFLRWLTTARLAPKTAAPGPGDYLQVYEELASAGVVEIISIHMGAKISAAFESATTAAAMLKEKLPRVRVEVIDSRNAALCQGWMVVEAARQAIAGASLQTISSSVRRLSPHFAHDPDCRHSALPGNRWPHRQGEGAARTACCTSSR